MRTEELARTYQSKSDDELIVLARAEGLTAEAQLVLRNELARRGIRAELELSNEEVADPGLSDKAKASATRAAHSVTEFTAAVTRMYRDNFSLFLKLTVPAMAIAYLAITTSVQANLQIAKDLFGHRPTASFNVALLEVGLINHIARFISGLASCVSFGAMCVAVDRILSGTPISAMDCVAQIKTRVGRFFGLSLLLMGLVYLAAFAGSFVIVAFLLKVKLGGYIQPITIMLVSLGFLLISRFGLAMPAVVLDNYKVSSAMFRSDELTEGKWLTLLVLLIKSVLGGYVAGMMPFWVATLIWRYVQLPSWLLTFASYLGVTLVEPFMFIGFALLYIRMTAMDGEQTSSLKQTAISAASFAR